MDEQERRFVLSYGTGDVPLQVTENSPYPMIARALVFKHIQEADEHEGLAFDSVYLVSFTYIMRNWVAVLTTTMPDSKYYAVTYDSARERALIETYVKSEQIKVAVPARRGKQ